MAHHVIASDAHYLIVIGCKADVGLPDAGSCQARLTHNVASPLTNTAVRKVRSITLLTIASGDNDPAEPEITGLAPSRAQAMLPMKPG